jgi:hypothetical protein
MITDTDRLDFLQAHPLAPGQGWRVRPSPSGRGLRLLTTTSPPIFPSVRDAIDYASGRLPEDAAAPGGCPRCKTGVRVLFRHGSSTPIYWCRECRAYVKKQPEDTGLPDDEPAS